MMLTVEGILIQHTLCKNILWPYGNLYFGRRYYTQRLDLRKWNRRVDWSVSPLSSSETFNWKVRSESNFILWMTRWTVCLLLDVCRVFSCQLVNRKGFCFILWFGALLVGSLGLLVWKLTILEVEATILQQGEPHVNIHTCSSKQPGKHLNWTTARHCIQLCHSTIEKSRNSNNSFDSTP